MRPRVPRVVAGGLAAVALTAAIGGAAYAQTSPPATGTPGVSAQQRAQDFINALATKLGKSPADVQAAFKAVEHDRIAQAVKDGKLTQAQADQINARIDAGTGVGPIGGFGAGPGHRGGPGKGPGGPRPGPGAMNPSALATFLGLTQPGDLRTALQGKSMAQVAADHGKTREQLKTFLTQQEKDRLDQAVKNNRLTQAQEDERLANFNTHLDQMIDRVFPAAGQGGPGRGRGPRGGAPAATPTA